ncbi:hypothetical protein NQ315_007946 [Exocentrus adspersus]|uniref:YqaJ viral recombinase domain-containing protein n=1 Tax=Exocentrus adspersus TaxID=1586481 RepID=A0AAV8VBN0_9CUCU|nr:hypothetical protein NQ315_007946 [Exocentrus adspersus]
MHLILGCILGPAMKVTGIQQSAMYIQVKRHGTECTVKSKICPEHKVRSKNYSVSVQINEETEEVLNAKCHDCAASEGGCKHAVAFLMWLHRRSEEPAPTDVACYWKKSRLASVGTSLKFIRVEDFAEINSRSSSNLPTESRGFLEDVIKEGIARKTDSQILKYFQDETDPLQILGMHQLLGKFILNGGKTVQEFITFSKNLLSDEICQKSCEATVSQSSNKLWHELHYGRITASRIYEVFRCKTTSGSLVESIVGSMKLKESLAMTRGKQLESQVLHVLKNETKIKFKPAGLLLSNEFPYLGASPDAISEDMVVEIKCPSTEKTFALYLKENKITNKCNGQIQLQMLLFKKKKGIFLCC